MSVMPSFLGRFRAVVIPTASQALSSAFLALLILSLAQSRSLLQRVGINPDTLSLGSSQFQVQFDNVLRSSLASQAALIAFWATVGLVAYLVCWGIYNLLIEARNKITLTTAYTNRTDPASGGRHWIGPLETLALKAVSAAALALTIGSLWYGLSFWITLARQAVAQPAALTIAAGLAAVLGLALQLYLLLVFVQLTFSPWYRAETFTDA